MDARPRQPDMAESSTSISVHERPRNSSNGPPPPDITDWSKMPVYNPPAYSPPGIDPPVNPPAPPYRPPGPPPPQPSHIQSQPGLIFIVHPTNQDDNFIFLQNHSPAPVIASHGAQPKQVLISRCCGCLNLRMGCVLIVIMYTIQSFANFGQSVSDILVFGKRTWHPLTVAPIALAFLMAECLGLNAVSHRKLEILKVYRIYVWVRVVIITALQIAAYLTSDVAIGRLSYFMLALLIVAQVYFNTCILSYYNSLVNSYLYGVADIT